MKNPLIIRELDRVRIVIPKIVDRVGYPKTVDDYIEIARAKYAKILREDMVDRLVEKTLREIAYGMAKKDGFGGRERSLHLKEYPTLLDKEFTVSGIRTVQTGVYYPPNYREYGFGECDYEPGGLMDMRSHRLASGFGFVQFHQRPMEIPVYHLKKIS